MNKIPKNQKNPKNSIQALNLKKILQIQSGQQLPKIINHPRINIPPPLSNNPHKNAYNPKSIHQNELVLDKLHSLGCNLLSHNIPGHQGSRKRAFK